MSLIVRPARESDQTFITALASSERINSTSIYWFNFFLATIGDELVGIAQVRRHRDGSRELGTLVVRREYRGKGVARQIVDAVMAQHPGRIFTITRASNLERCSRWGFKPTSARTAPRAVKRNYVIGAYGGRLVALLRRRTVNRLVVMERPSLPHRRREEFLEAQWF